MEPDAHSFGNILSILGFFESISALKINMAMSGLVGINVDNKILNVFVSSIGC